jgi:hypothetical protein
VPSSVVVIPHELAELFGGGVSILVGTRNASLLPDATRAAGAVVHTDRRHITLFLPTEVAARPLANIADNGLIAVGFSSMMDHRTVQVKGRVSEVRPAREDEREVCTRYHAAFGEVLAMAGINRQTVRGFNVWPATAVTFEATDLFQQSPGPNAGERLAATQ